MGEIDPAMTRSQAYEEAENVGRNESANPTLGDVIAQRYSRRDIMRGALASHRDHGYGFAIGSRGGLGSTRGRRSTSVRLPGSHRRCRRQASRR